MDSSTATQHEILFYTKKETCPKWHALFSLCLFIFVSFFSWSTPQTAHAETIEVTNDTTEQPYLTLITSDGFEQGLTKDQVFQLLHLEKSQILDTRHSSEIEDTEYCTHALIDCTLFLSTRDSYTWKTFTHTTVTESIAREFLMNIGNQIQKDPENTILTVKDLKATEFQMGSNGRILPINTNLSKLRSELPQILSYTTNATTEKNSLSLITEEIFPSGNSSDVKKYGIYNLLGEGRSDFSGSSRDRIFNIKRAANQFNNQLIPPGEILSFVDILGPVEKETGYRSELVIRNNKTEPEYGGGICQVSTTLYRAAMYSGLKITARQNHSYPVKYYKPIGFDATIYVPNPDLKIKNDTKNHILIQYDIEGNEFIFQIYGTNDKRKVEITGPYSVAKKHPDEYLRTELIQRVYSADNNLLREDLFTSSYDDPKNYPHPDDVLTEKPDSWSKSEWKQYRKENDL